VAFSYKKDVIDAQAREQNLTVIERDQLRQQKARLSAVSQNQPLMVE
jgi:hypothetical protein